MMIHLSVSVDDQNFEVVRSVASRLTWYIRVFRNFPSAGVIVTQRLGLGYAEHVRTGPLVGFEKRGPTSERFSGGPLASSRKISFC